MGGGKHESCDTDSGMRPDKPLLVPLAPSKLCVGPLTSTQHFLLALYWMPTTLSYIALAVLLLPDAIAQIVGTEQKAVVRMILYLQRC